MIPGYKEITGSYLEISVAIYYYSKFNNKIVIKIILTFISEIIFATLHYPSYAYVIALFTGAFFVLLPSCAIFDEAVILTNNTCYYITNSTVLHPVSS